MTISAETTTARPKAGVRKSSSLYFLRGVALISLLIEFWAAVILLPRALRTGAVDFSAYYNAGLSVRTAPSSLYEERTTASFIHPAYEALPFTVLALLPYRGAYFVFFAINLLVLFWIWRRYNIPWELLAFSGISLTLITGQDSIFLVALLFMAWKSSEERPFVSGILLGLCLFRFQNILPMMVLLLIWREWKVLRGFAVSGGIVLTVSAAMYSPQRYMTVVSKLVTNTYAQPISRMVNLRAVFFRFAPNQATVMTVAASIFILAITAYCGKKRGREWRITAAIIAAALVSYHFYIHDLSVLLVPLTAVIHHNRRALAACGLIFGDLALFNEWFYFIPFFTVILFATFMHGLEGPGSLEEAQSLLRPQS